MWLKRILLHKKGATDDTITRMLSRHCKGQFLSTEWTTLTEQQRLFCLIPAHPWLTFEEHSCTQPSCWLSLTVYVSMPVWICLCVRMETSMYWRHFGHSPVNFVEAATSGIFYHSIFSLELLPWMKKKKIYLCILLCVTMETSLRLPVLCISICIYFPSPLNLSIYLSTCYDGN